MDLTLRLARPDDTHGIEAIYAPYVVETTISFETVAPSAGEMARRLAKVMPTYPWLVADQDGTVAGYAYAGPHNDRAAYDWSVDVSAYVSPRHHRRGLGRALYTALFGILRAQGFHRAFAGITLPNPASAGLHEAMGFTPVGVYHETGWKHGTWRDVGWWERGLAVDGGGVSPPAAPLTLDGLDRAQLDAALAAGQQLIHP